MTREERRRRLESFGRAPAVLSAALRQFPKKMRLYKPAPDRWSNHEVILHLADAEATAYVCCRRFIAEPGSRELKFNSARWAGTLTYFHQSTREALEIIKRLRMMTYQLLLSIPESIWSHTAEHTNGGDVSLKQWLERQDEHIRRPVEQMKRNHEAWLRTHPPRKPALSPKLITASAEGY
jgi:hypothetical protein